MMGGDYEIFSVIPLKRKKPSFGIFRRTKDSGGNEAFSISIFFEYLNYL